MQQQCNGQEKTYSRAEQSDKLAIFNRHLINVLTN